MKITREADYALRIVSILSGEKTHTGARQIAEQSKVPYRFTLKILSKLLQAGLIKSFRGVNGGYAVNHPAAQITLLQVIEAIDGPIAINQCMVDPDICSNTGVCKVQKNLYQVQKMLADKLSQITFEDILNDEDCTK
jgi:Rrf2 family iron-sulfur cluster assembly transcriptional regulator